jgi:hypothetical protein
MRRCDRRRPPRRVAGGGDRVGARQHRQRAGGNSARRARRADRARRGRGGGELSDLRGG